MVQPIKFLALSMSFVILAQIFVLVVQIILTQGIPLDNKLGKFNDLINLKNSANRQKRHPPATETCGYPSCPETESSKLNVHIIAHTHDDVGWLKTVDQYFYGTRKFYSQVGVQFILDSLIPQLLMDQEKRFVYVEISFFSKWWEEQDDDMKKAVKQLVNEGRLEFINGGWCMNDEATVTYRSTIEQMTLGLKFLNETFGQCAHPKVGWQIDPFGHTNEQASLFAQFGFDGMFFTRIDYKDKERRTETKSLDLIWHGDRALPGQSGSIFTNVFRDGYDAPNGYCFDVFCKDDMIVDNKKSYEYNIEKRGQYMIDFIRDYANAKLTNQLLIPFGGDFQYSAAGQNFKALDKLIKYIRENAPDINIFYSTPSCYQSEMHSSVNEKKIKLPEKYDDFLPYDSSQTVWWSGYFTSRPSVKLIERETADLLQVSRLVSLSNLLLDPKRTPVTNSRKKRHHLHSKPQPKVEPKLVKMVLVEQINAHDEECLLPLWQVLGDLQHHDAVTGTEKQHVANDYVRRATNVGHLCVNFIGNKTRDRIRQALDGYGASYLRLEESGRALNLDPIYLEETSFCPLNISQCEPLEMHVDYCYHQSVLDTGSRSLSPEQACSRSSSLYRLSSSRRRTYPKELERKGVLVTAYNPIAQTVQNFDIRLPCIGRCELDKISVLHLATNTTMKLTRIPLPAGIESLPFRESLSRHEILFYTNLPALGSTSFVVSDTNEEDVVDDEMVDDHSEVRRHKRSETQSELSPEITAANEDCDHCENNQDEYISIPIGFGSRTTSEPSATVPRRAKREGQNYGGINSDRVIVKFDMQSGVIVGLRRISDGSFLNITQKFGTYSPSEFGSPSGAYIFRPSTNEPNLFQKPIKFKMVKRNNGSLIEIHQKWADWIYQTVRVDGKKNYIEFDYLVGPVPIDGYGGHEIITRYITNMQNQGVFFTDSNGRQMMPRHRLPVGIPEQLGGSFFPVVSSMMIRSLKRGDNSTTNGKSAGADKSAEAVAVLVDRPQAATSLNEGDLEFLIHRRLLVDDNFGVGEALDEPGEDGRGLITRGRHRLYLKFMDVTIGDSPQQEDRQLLDTASLKKSITRVFKLHRTPRANVTYALEKSSFSAGHNTTSPKVIRYQNETDVYLVHDNLMNDLRQESIKYALKPILTFDRLRVSPQQFVQLLSEREKVDFSLLNNTLPNNIHLLTLQAWNRKPNELLIRLENLDNPVTLSPFPLKSAFKKLIHSYKLMADAEANLLAGSEQGELNKDKDDGCLNQPRPETRVDIEYLIKGIRFASIEEYNLGANVLLNEDKRLDWTQERNEVVSDCDSSGDKSTTIVLTPRQIRTFLATFEFI